MGGGEGGREVGGQIGFGRTEADSNIGVLYRHGSGVKRL